MAVTIRRDLLRLHPHLHLKLLHAAVGTYPCRTAKSSLPLNRLLLVFADSGGDDSFLRDLATGERLPMRRDRVYFIPCGHEIDQQQTAELQFVSFQFTLDLFYGFDIMARFPECRMLHAPGLVAEARQLIAREDAPAALCGINALVYRLCAQWLAEQPELLAVELRHRQRYESLLTFVEQHADARTTVAMLAEMSDMRQDVFSRKFTAEMGLSPKEFITRVLMRKASLLLADPKLQIKQVARHLHFSSEYYFSRFFKKNTGLSPSDYQRTMVK